MSEATLLLWCFIRLGRSFRRLLARIGLRWLLLDPDYRCDVLRHPLGYRTRYRDRGIRPLRSSVIVFLLRVEANQRNCLPRPWPADILLRDETEYIAAIVRNAVRIAGIYPSSPRRCSTSATTAQRFRRFLHPTGAGSGRV